MGLLEQKLKGLLSYIEANTPRATRPVAKPSQVINQGLINPNKYNEPAASRFKDSAFGLLGVVPGVGDAASAVESADLFNRGENFAGSMAALGALPLVPALGGLVKQGGKVSDAMPFADALTQEQKAAAVNMEIGWFRGGAKPKDGKRTGPMYTRDANEAAGYAKRFKNGDVREYAIPNGPYLNAGSSYSHKLAHDVANILDDPYYGKQGQQLAKELRTFGPEERIGGGDIWQALEARYGNDGAAEVIDKIGYFKGAKDFTAPGEVYVFKSAPVRDANKAKFDPARLHKDDIYGRATVPAMLGAGAVGVGGLSLLEILDKDRQAAEERKR